MQATCFHHLLRARARCVMDSNIPKFRCVHTSQRVRTCNARCCHFFFRDARPSWSRLNGSHTSSVIMAANATPTHVVLFLVVPPVRPSDASCQLDHYYVRRYDLHLAGRQYCDDLLQHHILSGGDSLLPSMALGTLVSAVVCDVAFRPSHRGLCCFLVVLYIVFFAFSNAFNI